MSRNSGCARRAIGSLVAILASGCPADDGTAAESDGAGGSTSWMSLPDPTDEEAADLQMRVCEVLAVE